MKLALHSSLLHPCVISFNTKACLPKLVHCSMHMCIVRVCLHSTNAKKHINCCYYHYY